jgi:hypothetical protein
VRKHRRRPIVYLRFSPWRKSSLIKQCLQQEHRQAQTIKARPWIFTLRGKTSNFSCAVAPTFNATAPSHESPSQFLSTQRLETPLLVLISWLHDILRYLTSPMNEKSCHMMVTASRASQCSLWNQMVR